MTDYLRPSSLEEALALRARRPLAVLAGGTDLYAARAAQAGWGIPWRGDILDVSGLEALRGIAPTDKGWRLGALTTWSELASHALPPAFDGLRTAARQIGGRQVQNRGTLAGNLCTASPAGDGIPCLLALDAEVELGSLRGTRRVPLIRFISGYRQTVVETDELVTAILVPAPPAGARGGFLKLGARRQLVISIVMVSAVLSLEAGRIGTAALAVGACSAVARRLPALEKMLAGLTLAEALSCVAEAPLPELAPLDDIRGSAAHRLAAARQLLADLIGELGTPAPAPDGRD